MGGVGTTAAGAFLTPLVQEAGRAAGQWLGRNVLRPMVDNYEDKTPGTQSDRERRRQIVREGGRQGPPVPERLRQAPSRPSSNSSRPTRSGAPDQAQAPRPTRAPAAAARPQPQAPSRPQPQSSGPVSAPTGMNGDPLQGRTGQFNVEGSPLTAEPAPMPGTRPQAPVTASTPRPSAAESGQQPSFRGPGAPQPLSGDAPRPSEPASGTSTPESGQRPAAEPSSGQSERPAANSRLAIPSRGPTGREEMIQYNIQRARQKRKPKN
jgi:hypothetical protein